MHLNNVGSLWLRRYAVFVACCTFALVIAGGLVTSNDAALSVPDWPLSWGRLVPPLEGGIRSAKSRNCLSTRSQELKMQRPANRMETNMTRHSSIFCILGLLALTGCSRPAPDNREADSRTLREGEVAAFVKDWGGKDAGRIAAHYTDDGNVMVPNSPMMTGKGAIGTAMRDAMTDPNWSLALQPVQVEVSRGGDLGYTRGTY